MELLPKVVDFKCQILGILQKLVDIVLHDVLLVDVAML